MIIACTCLGSESNVRVARTTTSLQMEGTPFIIEAESETFLGRHLDECPICQKETNDGHFYFEDLREKLNRFVKEGLVFNNIDEVIDRAVESMKISGIYFVMHDDGTLERLNDNGHKCAVGD